MHSVFYRRTFQLATAAILGYALYRILEPLRGVIGWAAVLAFILYPLQERLTRRLKGRRALAAGILTVLTPFFVFVPLSVLGVVFAGQVARMIDYLRGHSLLSYSDAVERLAHVPLIGNAVAWVRENASIGVSEVQGWVSDSAQALLKSAAAMGGNVALGLFGTLVMMTSPGSANSSTPLSGNIPTTRLSIALHRRLKSAPSVKMASLKACSSSPKPFTHCRFC